MSADPQADIFHGLGDVLHDSPGQKAYGSINSISYLETRIAFAACFRELFMLLQRPLSFPTALALSGKQAVKTSTPNP